MVIVPADDTGIQQAVQALKNNEIVAYPTETVYGLAVNPFSEEALERLFKLKGREENKPVLLVIGELRQLDEVVSTVSEKAKRFMEEFWPGPLSLVLPAVPHLSKRITAGKNKVCVRWSLHPIAQRLALEFGHAITSTSANYSGDVPAKDVSELPEGDIAVAIETNIYLRNEVSTVFDPDTGEVFREGAIKKDVIQKIFNALSQG